MNYLSPMNTRYGVSPFSNRLLPSMEKEFETLFGNMPSLFDVGGDWFTDAEDRSLSPNWYEHDDGYVAKLELPGVDPKDVTLEVGDNVLSLSAERKLRSKKGEPEAKGSVSYSQSFSVPEGVDADKVTAAFEEGVLSITFPKTEMVKPRRINVK